MQLSCNADRPHKHKVRSPGTQASGPPGDLAKEELSQVGAHPEWALLGGTVHLVCRGEQEHSKRRL